MYSSIFAAKQHAGAGKAVKLALTETSKCSEIYRKAGFAIPKETQYRQITQVTLDKVPPGLYLFRHERAQYVC